MDEGLGLRVGVSPLWTTILVNVLELELVFDTLEREDMGLSLDQIDAIDPSLLKVEQRDPGVLPAIVRLW
jgi:hypothetical protein